MIYLKKKLLLDNRVIYPTPHHIFVYLFLDECLFLCMYRVQRRSDYINIEINHRKKNIRLRTYSTIQKIDKYIYMLWAELKFSQILNLTDCLGKFEICLVKKSVKFEICPESSGKFEI